MEWLLVFVLFFRPSVSSPTPKTGWFEQPLNHYNPQNSQYFNQKYLFYDECWVNHTGTTGETGPLFFYTGNEAPIEDFWDSAGFIFQAACNPQFGALVVFAEHSLVNLFIF